MRLNLDGILELTWWKTYRTEVIGNHRGCFRKLSPKSPAARDRVGQSFEDPDMRRDYFDEDELDAGTDRKTLKRK
jgi:hypothetical protein